MIIRWCCTVGLAAVAACGAGASSGTGIAADAAGQTGGDSGPLPDTAAIAAADTALAPPPLPPPAGLRGTVTVSELYMTGMMPMWMLTATGDFYRAEDFGAPTPVDVFGSCAVYEGGTGGQNGGAKLDAGTVEVTGGAITVRLDPSAAGYASDIPKGASNLFDDGDALHVAAAGGTDVPAFAADVVAPAMVKITAPDVEDGLDLLRTEDLTVAWEPAGGGDVFLEIVSGGVTVACSAADEDGQIVVPAAALANLDPTPPGAMMMDGGMLMLKRTNRTSVDAGDARVTLEASTTECAMGVIR